MTEVEASSSTAKDPPENILDGDVSSFFHSSETGAPWVKVHFAKSEVSRIVIVNRLDPCDICLERLAGTTIELFLGAEKIISCGTIDVYNTNSNSEEDQTYTIPCGNLMGDTVVIRGRATIPMNFAEIRLYITLIGMLI